MATNHCYTDIIKQILLKLIIRSSVGASLAQIPGISEAGDAVLLLHSVCAYMFLSVFLIGVKSHVRLGPRSTPPASPG